MEIFSIIIKICVLLMSIFLVVSVLMQEGKSYGLGAIEGGADTFFGKSKGQQVSSKLSRLTTVVAIIFVIVVIVLGIFSQRNAGHYDPIGTDEPITDSSFGSKTEEPTATPTPTVTKTPAVTVTPTATPTADAE